MAWLQLAALLVVAPCALGALVSGGCTSNADCSLNGLCSGGTCLCDKPV